MKWRALGWSAVILLLCGLGAFWWWWQWRDHSQDGPVLAAARGYGVEPALVKAVVWRESRFNPGRRGKVGEIGLMQLREDAALEWAAAEHITGFNESALFDPGTNTLAGTWYLEKLLKRYAHTDDPVPYALADYNAGRSNVLKWKQGQADTNSLVFIDRIGFPGTKGYVKSVMRREKHYQPIFPSKQEK